MTHEGSNISLWPCTANIAAKDFWEPRRFRLRLSLFSTSSCGSEPRGGTVAPTQEKSHQNGRGRSSYWSTRLIKVTSHTEFQTWIRVVLYCDLFLANIPWRAFYGARSCCHYHKTTRFPVKISKVSCKCNKDGPGFILREYKSWQNWCEKATITDCTSLQIPKSLKAPLTALVELAKDIG